MNGGMVLICMTNWKPCTARLVENFVTATPIQVDYELIIIVICAKWKQDIYDLNNTFDDDWLKKNFLLNQIDLMD